jgi:signal transduction histidine kinase
MMIAEELGHLKSTVNRFSEFARLPQVQPVAVRIGETLLKQLNAVAASFASAHCRLEDRCSVEVTVCIDVALFRQVLTNIIRNGVEANPTRRVTFDLVQWATAAQVLVSIVNDGPPVPSEIAERIFDPYVSTKSDRDNMGLGLAIVRKIVIEHGGDIEYQERGGRPCFLMTLPRIAHA